MGIRIHKVLGYGLTDVQVEGQWRIADPRINSSSHLLEDTEPEQSYPEFLETLAASGDEGAETERLMMQMMSDAESGTRYLCTWNGEYGLPNVLVVQPLGFPQWSRYDDPIDYEEEILRGDHPEPRVVRTFSGIYPFNGLHMDTRTGERIQGSAVNTWRRVINGKLGSDEKRPVILDNLARVMGYENHAEADQFVAPFVPEEVRRICAWGGLFTSPEVCFELRPMIYIYWA